MTSKSNKIKRHISQHSDIYSTSVLAQSADNLLLETAALLRSSVRSSSSICPAAAPDKGLTLETEQSQGRKTGAQNRKQNRKQKGGLRGG